MRIGRYSIVTTLVLALAACGGSPPAPPAPEAAPPPPPAAEAPAAEGAAAPAATATENAELAAAIARADLARGKILFLQCRACHSLLPDSEPGKIGPTLHAVIGRAAGTAADFAYSDVVAKSGITWTVEQIDHWLQRPSEFLPGNKMVFVGMQNPQDRADVIAFIQQESAKQAP